MSIKCGDFSYQNSCGLLGDAAHNMTPFYGMGMNTGLEDVRILFEDFIDPAHRDGSMTPFCPAGVIQRYTQLRKPDVQDMTDLARANFDELKHGLPSPAVIARKRIESCLQKYVPALD